MKAPIRILHESTKCDSKHLVAPVSQTHTHSEKHWATQCMLPQDLEPSDSLIPTVDNLFVDAICEGIDKGSGLGTATWSDAQRRC